MQHLARTSRARYGRKVRNAIDFENRRFLDNGVILLEEYGVFEGVEEDGMVGRGQISGSRKHIIEHQSKNAGEPERGGGAATAKYENAKNSATI